MILTQQQKVLVESILMVVDEVTVNWSPDDRLAYHFNNMIIDAFQRIRNMLQHEKSRDIQLLARGTALISEVIGKEVRKARAYTDMSAKEIIKALDAALEILKKNR